MFRCDKGVCYRGISALNNAYYYFFMLKTIGEYNSSKHLKLEEKTEEKYSKKKKKKKKKKEREREREREGKKRKRKRRRGGLNETYWSLF